jgi:hypothetical protein
MAVSSLLAIALLATLVAGIGFVLGGGFRYTGNTDNLPLPEASPN